MYLLFLYKNNWIKNFRYFKNHNTYNGVFLGLQNKDWHLEFTESNEKVNHHSDKDDLLVFYFDSQEKINKIFVYPQLVISCNICNY